MSTDERLTADQAASLAGVRRDTWHSYVSRGQAPEPDGRVGRTPWWWRSTVERYLDSRPGQGARTDRA
ncbi:transcriptional regulator [Marinitenerispora sediminis]|uniref:Transcriptional regulator n=2 Tax=Marinitenerispora sediminis TaxID=1931232 RepID=A0A368T677_9ACTN|nr:transcriptional regulator [Marinitenerispora sediminis]RCV54828.1 transcriptional regulator [Marinitenerispora sediminis]RCV58972.1 transcriptional regulator [Marinitenerispora sediminis]